MKTSMKKSNFTLIELMVVAVTLGIVITTVIITVLIAVLLFKGCNMVKDDGLKPSIERVWEGEQMTDTTVEKSNE